MAALNPDYDQQNSIPLPVVFGYGYGSGTPIVDIEDPNGDWFFGYTLFDGDNDGIEMIVDIDQYPGTAAPVHYHSGTWTPIGIPLIPNSAGPDQKVDEFFSAVPAATPPQSLSGIANYWYDIIKPLSAPIRGTQVTLSGTTPQGTFRGTRCRYFDANGNVTGYGFTTCPTWQIVEALLRWKFKVQQPQIAGLTAPEKDLFNWPAIVAHAAWCDEVVASGFPRWMSNLIFANDGTLGGMLETMLRVCRSYIDDQDGKIGIFAHDYFAPSFALTQNHIIPGTFKVAEKNVMKAPNVFTPKFRDLHISAVASVTRAIFTTGAYSDGVTMISGGEALAIFETGGVSPFNNGQLLIYGGSSDPSFDGMYVVDQTPNPADPSPPIICLSDQEEFLETGGLTFPGPGPTGTVTGGYVGAAYGRFQPQAPTTVQHVSHQKLGGQLGPGITQLPRKVPVEYDLGNMTYDQAYRLMKYESNKQLGIDTGADWKPPLMGSALVRYDAVDANGNAFIRMRPGEVNGTFTADDTVIPEYAWAAGFTGSRTFILTSVKPSKKDGTIAIEFYESPGAEGYPDTSADPPTPIITKPGLKKLGTSEQLANVAWCLQATPAHVGTTCNIPDLKMQIVGRSTPTTYGGAASWAGLTSSAPYVLYVDDNGVSTPTFGSQAGAGPLTSPPPYRYVVLQGVFT